MSRKSGKWKVMVEYYVCDWCTERMDLTNVPASASSDLENGWLHTEDYIKIREELRQEMRTRANQLLRGEK